jgi:hypothetical protein
MAILGESFKDYVNSQVYMRQNKLSSFNKDNELLSYLTSNTTFVRLTSGVDVTSDILNDYGLPQNLAGNELAKRYILEAARFNNSFSADVGYNLTSPSYGFASSPEYGFMPPPGITQIAVKSLNRGTIREATIQLMCHNVTQLYIISILFLKLKYSLLLEWGHTVYYNNSGQLVQGFGVPNLSLDFLEKGNSPSKLLPLLENKRKESCGNYDAFFGWIKNFQWEIQENGTYNITISAISTGDVIESLKINTNFDPNAKDEKDDNKYSKSTLHSILGVIRKNKTLSEKGYLNGYNTGDDNCLNTIALAALANISANYQELEDTNTVSAPNNILSDKEAIRVKFPNLQVTSNKNGTNIQNDQYYIKLGTLLRIIESFLLFYDLSKSEPIIETSYTDGPILGSDGQNIISTPFTSQESSLLPPLPPPSPTDNKPPIFKFDHNFETNKCLTTINQVPSDPRIALIPLSSQPSSGPMSSISTGYRVTPESFAARVMHIYVNIDYIISTLDDNIDDKRNISVLAFLTSLLSGINSALGCINQFEIDYDDATNTFSIIDTALVPFAYQNKEEKEITRINVNYFNQSVSSGSFVTNFGLKTDIYSSIGNAIALGAQNGGSSLNAASTSYSNLNTGITDRIVTVKDNKNNKTNKEAEEETKKEQENIKKEFANFVSALNSTDKKKALTPDNIDYYNTYIVDVLQKDLYTATQSGRIPGTIFIPLNLNLTLTGISGIRQYQVFTITENILPKEYYDKLKFITTTIEHKVDIKGWETTINTIGAPYKKTNQNPPPLTSLLSYNEPSQQGIEGAIQKKMKEENISREEAAAQLTTKDVANILS